MSDQQYSLASLTETEAQLRTRLATLCRMLGMQGSIGMFGHVSIRVPGTDRVLMTPGAGSDKTKVTPEQLFVYNIAGEILEHPGVEIPLEWRIHTQIHKDHEDAFCVAHLHAPHATVLGIAGKDIQPVFLHGAFLHEGVTTWDNPRLVVRDDQAQDLSKTLGDGTIIQMRGHGSVVVGTSAESTFFACLFLEENSRQQLEADAAGGAVPLSAEEARDCARGTLNPRLFNLLWDYYARQVNLD